MGHLACLGCIFHNTTGSSTCCMYEGFLGSLASISGALQVDHSSDGMYVIIHSVACIVAHGMVVYVSLPIGYVQALY